MTWKEKMQIDAPHDVNDKYSGGVYGCPKDRAHYGCPHINAPSNELCTKCWNREIPDTEKIIEEKEETIMSADTKKTKAELIEELEDIREREKELAKQVENLERYKQYEDLADEMGAMKQAFVNSGFTDDQAFTMIMEIIKGAAKMNMRSLF